MPKLPTATTDKPTLRVPQARVLKVLMPSDTADHWVEWPTLTRHALAVKAGFNPISGTLNRVLNGIREGSSSGDAHPGIVERGLVKVVPMEVNEGVWENSYRITAAGIRELQRYLAQHKIPKRKDKASCVNDRYQ